MHTFSTVLRRAFALLDDILYEEEVESTETENYCLERTVTTLYRQLRPGSGVSGLQSRQCPALTGLAIIIIQKSGQSDKLF